MAVLRDNPYGEFNFLVDLGTGETKGPEAGFQECSAIGMEVAVAEYRNGNDDLNSVRKITGLNKALDVTLKRGVIGSLEPLPVAQRDPQRGPGGRAHRPHPPPDRGPYGGRVTWTLLQARIIKHTSGPFNAKGTDVAMEELTLAYERLEME